MTYPNGNECAYISIVFDGEVGGGNLMADVVEISQCAWLTTEDLANADFSTVSRSANRRTVGREKLHLPGAG